MEDVKDVKIDFTNPWAVSDASVFLRYCCPECEQTCLNLHDFTEHALKNHEKALTLFSDIKVEPFEEIPKKKRKKVVKKVEHEISDHDQLEHEPIEDFNDIECLKAVKIGDKWTCSQCGFDQVEHHFELIEHWLEHHNFKNVQYEACQWCSTLFSDAKTYLKHCSKDHPKLNLKEYKCQKCDFKSAKICDLKTHGHKCHNLQNPVLYQCDTCHDNFIFEQHYLHHLTKHIEVETLNCDICHTLVYGHTNILVHQSSHNFTELYFCKFCDFTSVTKVDLITHHKTCHDRLLPPYFKCDMCDFISKYNAVTISHAKKEHDHDYQAFECSTCGWKKNNLTYMLKHMEVR